MIRAKVKVKKATISYSYTAVGKSTWEIEESARDLAGDEPCSITVIKE